MNPLLIILGVIGGIFALVVFGLAFNIIGLWFQSVVSGAKSGLFDLIMMRFRKSTHASSWSIESPPKKQASTSPPTGLKHTSWPGDGLAMWSWP